MISICITQLLLFVLNILILITSKDNFTIFDASNLLILGILIIIFTLIIRYEYRRELRKESAESFIALSVMSFNVLVSLIYMLRFLQHKINFIDNNIEILVRFLFSVFVPIIILRLARNNFLKISFFTEIRFILLFFVIGYIALLDSDLFNSLFILFFIACKRIDGKEINVMDKENNHGKRINNKNEVLNDDNNFLKKFSNDNNFYDLFFAFLYLSLYLSIHYGLAYLVFGPYEDVKCPDKIMYSIYVGVNILLNMEIFVGLYSWKKFRAVLSKSLSNFINRLINDINIMFS